MVVPEQKDSVHFVANLRIEKVEKPQKPTGDRGVKSDRVIDEVTQITIKADTLPSLVDKLGKHIAIVEED